MARCIALVPAAGTGARMGAAMPKQYLDLLGYPLLWHSLQALLAAPSLDAVYLALAPDDTHYTAFDLPRVERVNVLRCGGASRAETVRNALLVLSDQLHEDDWVIVHDAARPCLRSSDVERLIATLADDPIGGLLAVPLADTLKRADADGRIAATVSRDALWRAQTPQMFRYAMLKQALAHRADAPITDEASAMEAIGHAPRLVAGDERNLKVTFPQDLALAALWLSSDQT